MKQPATMPYMAGRSFSTWLRNHIVAASLIILLCSMCPRVILAWRTDPAELVKSIPDAMTYLWPAQSLVERGTFSNQHGQPEVERTPGYPAFLAMLMGLIGQDLRKVFLAQAAILSFSVLILYWLARCILPPALAFIGSLLAAFSPWGIALAVVPLTEGLFLALLALILLIIKLAEQARNCATAVLAGGLVGLLTSAAVLVRPLWPLVILMGGVLLLRYGVRRSGVWVVLLTMLVCAFTPLYLWKERNQRERHFNGLSSISGVTVWLYLASRVQAEVHGEDRFAVSREARLDERTWALPVGEADTERWRRATAILRKHPALTTYSFLRSAAEHAVHPSPDVLTPAKLNFRGDYFTLALLWGGFLSLACVGLGYASAAHHEGGEIDRGWLLTMLVICSVITLSSGISFGQGARLRAPLELIVPLLAAIGLQRLIHMFQQIYNANLSQVQPESGRTVSR